MYVNGGKKTHESTYFTRNKVINIMWKVTINVPGCTPGSIGSDTGLVAVAGPTTHGHVTSPRPPRAHTKDKIMQLVPSLFIILWQPFLKRQKSFSYF